MTQDEEIISNISYTSSDFRSIYPQLLDTAKKLTNKWDPSLSNESDPGNILIKEAAIVGDKVNYHIDKNVLECFPLSATQQASARQIYDLVGYNMHWYRSAVGKITLQLLKSIDNIGLSDSITIDAGTVFSDTTGEYVYSTLNPITLSQVNTLYQVDAIQGIINQYDINGNTLITIDNLDENLRIYFPQNIIAENGVYVYDAANGNDPRQIGFDNTDNSGAAWKLVDNLTKYPAKSKIFKFGLDLTSDNCYIEFPEDIAVSDLIGSGLNIYYTTTLGETGNLKSGIINKFLSDYTQKNTDGDTIPINDYIVISNLTTSGGVDPESLENAYKNYKKLIGTYDTLVTRRDYENAIYNLEESSKPLISNVIVTDRTTDMNYSQKVIETNLTTDYAKNYVVKTGTGSDRKDIMQSYDIVLYLLKQPDSMLTVNDYNKSFEPDTSSVINNTEDDIEEYKSVQHNLYYIHQLTGTDSDISNSLYFNINDICELKGNLTTYYKVSKSEASEIEANVTKALLTAYNSRAIDFGNELSYNSLIDTIKNADDRIRNISLDTPVYEPKMVTEDGTVIPLYSDDNTSINDETIAKMILSGNIQLFKFQEDFQLDFGQSDTDNLSEISTLSTLNSISINSISAEDEDNYITLNENDIIQLVQRNLIPTETYNATVGYQCNFGTNADTAYILGENDILKLVYIDPNTSKKTSKYIGPGEIIITNGFALQSTGNITNDTNYSNTIKAGESIQKLVGSSITISPSTPYYVITKNINTDSKTNKEYYNLELTDNEYILKEDEYLLYTNPSLDGIAILGSGTSITATNTVTLSSEVIPLSDIMSSDSSSAIRSWNRIPLDITLSAYENKIITLSKDDKIEYIMENGSNPIDTCNNDLQSASGTFKYILASIGDDTVYSLSTVGSYNIRYRSNLILSGNNITPQVLTGKQQIIDSDNQVFADADNNDSVLYSYPINIAGGDNIDVRILNESTGQYENKLSLYKYVQVDPTSIDNLIRDNKTGLLTIKNDDDSTTADYSATLNFKFTKTSGYEYYMLPISTINNSNGTVTITVKSGDIIDTFENIDKTDSSVDNSYPISGSKNIILFIKVNADSLNDGIASINVTFDSNSDEKGSISFGYIQQTVSLNSDEINSEDIANNNYYKYNIEDSDRYNGVKQKLEAILDSIGNPSFDWTYRVPETNKVLQPISGKSYFNPNHVYNKCTLPKIDFEYSSITVNPASIR